MSKVFPGFRFPEKNYYQFPKDLNGYYSQLSGNEFKVLSYIVRKTWGFNKVQDRISFKQFLEGLVNKDGVKVFDGLGMATDTLSRILNSLSEKGFIDIVKEKGKTNIYKLNYLENPSSQPLGKSKCNYLENPSNNNINNNSFTKVSKPNRGLQVISLFMKETGIVADNKLQFQQIIKRNLRPAKNLIGYSDQDIKDTIKTLKNTEYLKKFTLETVGKYIDQVVAEKKKEGGKPIRFEEIKKPDGTIIIKAIYQKNDQTI